MNNNSISINHESVSNFNKNPNQTPLLSKQNNFTSNTGIKTHNVSASAIPKTTKASGLPYKEGLATNFSQTGINKQQILALNTPLNQNAKNFTKNLNSSSNLSNKLKPTIHNLHMSQNEVNNNVQINSAKSGNILSKGTKPKIVENSIKNEKVENNNYNINVNLNIISPKNVNSNGFIFTNFSSNNDHNAPILSKPHPSTVKGNSKIEFISSQKKQASLKKFINK